MKKILKELIVPLLVLTLVILSVWGVYLKQNTRPLPVLMYHHFAETAGIDTVVTPARFREQMTTRDSGANAGLCGSGYASAGEAGTHHHG